jgi:hypothetical protein
MSQKKGDDALATGREAVILPVKDATKSLQWRERAKCGLT